MEHKFNKPIGQKSWEPKLYKSLAEKACLRFKTRHPANDTYYGIITHIKPSFVVLHSLNEFELDGFIILPKQSIKSIRDSSPEHCANEILRYNGQIKKYHIPSWLNDCETIPHIIAKLKNQDIWPGIEILFNHGKTNAYYLGPITEVQEASFSLKCYSATGIWEKNYKLDYNEIFKVCVDTRYETHFNAYMRLKENQ